MVFTGLVNHNGVGGWKEGAAWMGRGPAIREMYALRGTP